MAAEPMRVLAGAEVTQKMQRFAMQFAAEKAA